MRWRGSRSSSSRFPAPSLTWARGSHESPQGLITVEWRIEDGELHIAAEIPAATSARIVFPDGTETVAGPGAFPDSRSLRHPSSVLTAAH